MKAIITVIGKDKVGIIARVCTFLADKSVNVLEISQTIVKGYFDMMMIVDIEKMACTPVEIVKELDELGADIGVVIKFQREEIFETMHRI
jgi:ACT domain-containing protein